MTIYQLHLEVLKAMGWKSIVDGPYEKFWNPNKGGTIQDASTCVPPLTLDMMWQAEEMLSEVDCGWVNYIEELTEITLTPVGGFQHFSKRDIFQLSHATAEQRARAFLKVKGLA